MEDRICKSGAGTYVSGVSPRDLVGIPLWLKYRRGPTLLYKRSNRQDEATCSDVTYINHELTEERYGNLLMEER